MCGIVGYYGNRDAAPILYGGLVNLEYRGYDSCGIACVHENTISIKKGVGNVAQVHSKLNLADMSGTVGIGHTRWATHGGVTKDNTHPHISNDGKIAVVHNGIIDNYQKQKTFLKSQGFTFVSETDTEVIPNLIEYFMRDGTNFKDAVVHALTSLEGQYAIVAIDNQGNMVAARKEAPLLIGVGIGETEFFVASDMTAILPHTKDIIFLEDYDVVSFGTKLEIINMNKGVVTRLVETINWCSKQTEKGNFDHYFIKEICEQAEVIRRITEIDPAIIKSVAAEIKAARGIFIVACGTAAYAAMTGTYLFSKIAKIHVNFCIASEFENFCHFITDKSLIIAISQSGETADTLGAIRVAKARGAKVISISNVNGSSLMRESYISIDQKADPEIAVNSTKAYTSQLAILSLIAYELDGGIEGGLQKLKEVHQDIIYLTSFSARKHVSELAELLKNREHLYLIGRGLQYPTALEAAHKIKEASYIHAEAFAGGELKHGSNALIEFGTPYIAFVARDNETDIINNAIEVKARGAYVIGIGNDNNPVFDFFLKVRDAGDYNPIVQIIPMQILAYTLAVIRGCDPDKPRNLAKCVTVK